MFRTAACFVALAIGTANGQTCSSGKFDWSSCANKRSCASPSWDGCAYNNCQQKIDQGTAVSHCSTTAGTPGNQKGCNYGSDSNTCAYDLQGKCCYSDVMEEAEASVTQPPAVKSEASLCGACANSPSHQCYSKYAGATNCKCVNNDGACGTAWYQWVCSIEGQTVFIDSSCERCVGMGNQPCPSPKSSPKCPDQSGVCCQAVQGECGMMPCDIDQIRTAGYATNTSQIYDYGCGGKGHCCFYPANGGLYCSSCDSSDISV